MKSKVKDKFKLYHYLSLQEDFEDMLEHCDDIRKKYENDEMSIEDVLHAISVYKCEQAVANMSITFNMITDSKDSKRVYVQARGAVPFKKGERKWVGVHLGKKKDIVDSTGSIPDHWRIKGEAMVRAKILNALKAELNPY
jgi:hypothetical protein